MKKNMRFLPQDFCLYLAVFVADIGGIVLSLGIAWSSTALEKLMHLDDNPLGRKVTSTEQGILGSLPTVGAIFGSFISSYIARAHGRKFALLFGGLSPVISYGILTFASNIWLIYIGRFICGLNVGTVFSISTVYTVEIAENSNRGFLCSTLVCFVNLGYLFSFILGPLVSYKMYHIVCLSISVLYTVLVLILVPESPYYLVPKNYAEAERSLMKLRGKSDVVEELNAMRKFVETNEKASWSEILADKCSRKALFIGSSLLFIQQFSGTSVLSAFPQQMFDASKEYLPNPPLVLALVALVLCPITPLVIDKLGRKVVLLISLAGNGITLFLAGLCFFWSDHITYLSYWFPFIILIVNAFFCVFGIIGIPWVYIGEIIPLKSTENSVLVCNIITNLSGSITLLTFPIMVENMGMGPTFWCYTVIALIGIIYIKFYIFETKGKSLPEIQEIMKSL